ncbi:hypothetical protein [Pseudooceanicola sp.]|uniref:hypothetical protein n=1 Tax=Pseudooceanicola sp. TaxID=1914328 RepID=UPI003511572F
MTTETKEKPQITKAPPTPSDTQARLGKRKVELNATIEAQTLLRATATLDGGEFDPATLKAAQDELAAVEDAEREQVRRIRAIAADEALAKRKKSASKASKLLKEWVGAIDDAELSARSMVDAIKRGEEARVQVQRLLHEVLGATPVLLLWKEHETRRSQALCALIHDFKRNCSTVANALSYGDVSLHPGMFTAADSWSKAERQVADDLESKLREIMK